MSPTDTSARPSQVTIAGWAIAIASVMLVVAVFDAMGALHSVDMRDRLTRAVSTGSAKGFGLSVDDATAILRWCLFVCGAAAAASGILGVFVLQRDRAARIGLTVAAVLIVITAPSSGRFFGILIGVATAMLWTRPARDWFAGRPITPRPTPVDTSARSTPGPSTWAPPTVQDPAGNSDRPPPTSGWGQAPPVLPPPVPGTRVANPDGTPVEPDQPESGS